MGFRSRRLHWKAKGINTRKKQGEEANSIARRGQGGTSSLFVCPLQGQGTVSLVGFGATPQLFLVKPTQRKKSTRRRQRSVPASNFALPQERPQAALPTTCALSRQMGATELLDFRFCLFSPNILFNPSLKTDQHGITPCWSVLYSAYFSGASGVVGVGGTGALP